VDLGERLLHGFNDNSGVPFSDVNLQTHQAHKPRWGPDRSALRQSLKRSGAEEPCRAAPTFSSCCGSSSTSEVTTIQLEFKSLSFYTKNRKYFDKVARLRPRWWSQLPPSCGAMACLLALAWQATLVMEHVRSLKPTDGLVPIFINANSGQHVCLCCVCVAPPSSPCNRPSRARALSLLRAGARGGATLIPRGVGTRVQV
jgi:mannosyl-oligosaccharide alpha-1,2-mannosidase